MSSRALLPRTTRRGLGFFARATPPTTTPPPPSPSTSSTRPPPQHSDLLIIGGGPAGLCLAAALAASEPIAQTHQITLLEASPLASTRNWSPNEGHYSNRVSSITAENVKFLSKAGIWQHLDLTRVRPISSMEVWDGLSNSRISFSAPFLSNTSSLASDSWESSFASALKPQRGSMSTMVENLNLQRAALRRIEELQKKGARVELVEGKRVSAIEEGEGGWPVVKLEGDEARSLRTRLLIGADGANSPVKAYSNIETFGWQYGRHGLVASLTVDRAPPGREGEGMDTAWQRFLPEGPVAFLPLSDSAASLVWSTTPEIASKLKSLPPSVFSFLVTCAFTLPYPTLSSFLSSLPTSSSPPVPGPAPPSTLSESESTALVSQLQSHLLAHSRETYDPANPPAPLPPSIAVVQPGSVASFPLRLSHTASYLGLPEDGKDKRTVLVGDAAHTVHPLAGQGLNMGLGDAQKLVEVLEERTVEGGDVGSYLSLLPYPRSRYPLNHALLSACDHFSSLYSSRNTVIVAARSTGVEVLNELESVKGFLMRRAGAGEAAPTEGVAAAFFGAAGAERARGGRKAAVWEVVADGLEKATQARKVVGFLGSAVLAKVGKRAAEFVVKGR